MSAAAKVAPVAQPLDLLMLDLKAKHAAYRNALAWRGSAPGLASGDDARVEATRAELGRAAAALALWCGESVPESAPESHGARRSRIADARLDFDRRRARELAEQAKCRACSGSGLRPGFDLDPCVPCGGTGVA